MSDSSVALSWEPLTLEEARGFVTGYTVTAVPITEAERRRQGEIMTTVDPNTSRVVLNGLDPRLPYWVSVSGSTAVGTSTNNLRVLAEPSLGKVTFCHSIFLCRTPPDSSTAQRVTDIVTAVGVTLFITCVGTLLLTTLAAVLVMRRCLNKLHSEGQTQEEGEQDGAYEMVEKAKPVEAEYEVVDHEPKEVKTSPNPAYAAVTTNISQS